MVRPALERDESIVIRGKTYRICEVIGEGGYSLVYSAKAHEESAAFVIKEYFPIRGAFRDRDRRVKPLGEAQEPSFLSQLRRFQQEGVMGNAARIESFQAVAFFECENGYGVMRRWSKDMRSVMELVKEWKKTPPEEVDPCFTDSGRIIYALTVVSSVLAALGAFHKQNKLHLDISGNNIVWAGDFKTWKNCVAFLTDFGCAAAMSEGSYCPETLLSGSPGFMAPEFRSVDAKLTPATDLYSVAMLLLLLSGGEQAMRSRFPDARIKPLKIPIRIREQLIHILSKGWAVDSMHRYQSAEEMQKDVLELLDEIPTHPINRDTTRSFTLYSLKSMINGSTSTTYGWAEELRDRRAVDSVPIPEGIREGLSYGSFEKDELFLEAILPKSINTYLKGKIKAEGSITWNEVMSGRYPDEWRKEMGILFQNDSNLRLRETCKKAERLLDNEKRFSVAMDLLFRLLGEEALVLRKYFQRCHGGTYPHNGLALITLFALFGRDFFEQELIRGERDIALSKEPMRYFRFSP